MGSGLKLRSPAGLTVIGIGATLALAAAVVVVLLLFGGGAKAVSENAALIGALVALGGIFTTQLVNSALEAQRAEREAWGENQRAQDDALQAYLDYVSKLLIDDVVVSTDAQARTQRATSAKFVSSLIEMNAKNPQLFTLIRVSTLVVLARLDAYRKPYVLGFLYESGLIYRDDEEQPPALELSGADLSNVELGQSSFDGICLSQTYMSGAVLTGVSLRDADLSGADLGRANLSGAVLRGAVLSDADLSGAVLTNAIVTEEQLEQARSLEDATMPDGQKYEDW